MLVESYSKAVELILRQSLESVKIFNHSYTLQETGYWLHNHMCCYGYWLNAHSLTQISALQISIKNICPTSFFKWVITDEYSLDSMWEMMVHIRCEYNIFPAFISL